QADGEGRSAPQADELRGAARPSAGCPNVPNRWTHLEAEAMPPPPPPGVNLRAECSRRCRRMQSTCNKLQKNCNSALQSAGQLKAGRRRREALVPLHVYFPLSPTP
ncbi:MAG: hypothetical protein ACO2PM_00350, partial [Pyrobaculum sp.]